MLMNLKVRLKQKWFWITLIPLLFLFGEQIYDLVNTLTTVSIGEALSGGVVQKLVLDVVGVLFSILALIGFPVDLTTDGYGDSERALDYTEPAPNASETIALDEKLANAKHAKE